jgi:hypothetical protein
MKILILHKYLMRTIGIISYTHAINTRYDNKQYMCSTL